MELTIDELRENYKRFTDEQLIRLATTDASGLRPEAVVVMREEINKRKLPNELLDGIDVQRKEISEEELISYCDIIQSLSCPRCGSSANKLNAMIIGTAISFLFWTNYEKRLLIACPSCLEKANREATIKTAILGWWGIPWGIVHTIQALVFNGKMSSEVQRSELSKYLLGFVAANIGVIEVNKNDKDYLLSLIRQQRG
jgi:hypothetical protein